VKVIEALNNYSSLLKQHGLDEAEIDAKVLVSYVLKLNSAKLLAESASNISANDLAILDDLIIRRINRTPIAYITSNAEFFDMDLYVNSNVLIPRPETELLVEEAIKICNVWLNSQKRQVTVADVGTGSGAIALALMKNIADCKLYAIDKSQEALKVARINARRHNLDQNIVFIKGDLLDQICKKVDLVVANLPYVPTWEISLLSEEISKYEPLEALNGGEDGLTVITDLIKQLPGRLVQGGAFLLEIGVNQDGPIECLVKQYFPGCRIQLIRDLAGINRVIKVETRAF
jgi:release factor glutamine methyltransferase